MAAPQQPRFARALRSARVGLLVAAWFPAMIFVGLLLSALWPQRPFVLDLICNFVPHAAALALVVGAAGTVTRRLRYPAITCLAAGAGLAAVHLASIQPPVEPGPEFAGGPTIRVIQFNAHSERSANDVAFQAYLEEQDADLVCLIETPWSFARTNPWVLKTYPYRVEPDVGLDWPNLLLSKHPLELTPLEDDRPEHRFSFVARRSVTVTLPSGEKFLWTAMHPPSPRSESSWRKSLEIAARDAEILRRFRDRTNAGVLVTGDFNSAPTARVHSLFAARSELAGWSSRWPGGTWPGIVPSWLSIPIDRIWTGGGLVVTSLEVGPKLASDHRPIVAELAVLPRSGGPKPAENQNRATR